MSETRQEKARRLVDEGAVVICQHNSMFTMAHVTGDHRNYATFLFSSGHFYCECEWGAFHSHTDDLCAHALAVKLAVERRNP